MYGFASGATPTCVADTVNGLIKLSGVFPVEEDLLILNMFGVYNPKYETLRTIQIQSYSDSDATNLIENSGLSSFSFSSTAGDMICIVEGVERTLADANPDLVSSNIVAKDTDITVSFTVEHEVPSGGFFVLEMPKWNSGT